MKFVKKTKNTNTMEFHMTSKVKKALTTYCTLIAITTFVALSATPVFAEGDPITVVNTFQILFLDLLEQSV